MYDPVAAGRRTALRAVAATAIVAALVATAFLAQGRQHALAAALAGLGLVAGNGLAAVLALGGGIVTAQAAFARLLLATLGKWLLVMAALVVTLGVWQLPALPALIGLVAGLLAHAVALNFDKQGQA